jgi:hypothetical protein
MAKGIISVETTGSFKNIEGFLKRTKRKNLRKYLEAFGERGVILLSAETPVDTGETASSWSYEIVEKKNQISIYWKNSAMAGMTPVVILIIHGHVTRDGGYVEPNDFVSPVINELFQEMADTIWKEVTRA